MRQFGIVGSGERMSLLKQELLRLLDQGDRPVSGEALSRMLGKSRTAVWQWIEELRADGYVIEAAPRRGYTLVSRPDRLYAWEVQGLLSTAFVGRHYEYHLSVESTNDVAKTRAKEGAPEGLVVVAEEQVKGRGRRGRSWASPFGLGVWVSVLLRPRIAPTEAPKGALVAALAVAEAVGEATGLEAAIKWPNDVLVAGKKVSGILVEMDAELEEVRSLVVGVGINANVPLDAIPPEARDRATSLMEAAGQKVDRRRLLAAFLSRLEERYKSWLRDGFGRLLPELRERTAYLGEPVRIVQSSREWHGVALDLADDGALLVRDARGNITPVYAAEVSLRAENA